MKLQFKHQAFQAEAAAAVCDVFSGQPLGPAARGPEPSGGRPEGAAEFGNQPLELTEARVLENLRAVQRRGGLRPSEALAGPGINLSVEMETGTGKTYTYVKTMYELNRRYGWSKFIVVVPSVAIREGVYQSLRATQEHFAEEYGRKLRFFIYASDRLTEVERFASDSAIHVMIINMQAFNSQNNRRVIDRRMDGFRSRRPMDIIAGTRPILIIDEPQSMGRQTAESLEKFRPLFTVRYSATHRERYDMVYRLDAADAYSRHLVKRIAALGVTLAGSTATGGYVYLEGVDLYRDRPPAARLGFEVREGSGIRTVVRRVRDRADLFALSHGLEEYADRYVIPPGGIDGRDNSVTFLNGLKLYAGQISGDGRMAALQRRVQIRETIRTHLRRERELYPRGIKVLSLFFIDEVAKYRLYDGDGGGRSGEYARMFEEEYAALAEELCRELREAGGGAYLKYLEGIDARRTHQGYFSIDRRGGGARFVEGKINKKTQTSDDAGAYDLIMRDKERLLSLEEPVRFLFSHSALREGWDNPNVFQICTLKPQSESEIRSRQEIGRGLRLCVNQRGERMDESALGEEVQQVNKLTLITDMAFGRFAEALQSGLAEAMAGRPRRVDAELFAGRVLVNARGEAVEVTPALAEDICGDLIRSGYLRRGELTDKYYEDRDSGAFRVAERAGDCTASVLSILSTVYDSRSIEIEDACGGNVEAAADPEKLRMPEFLDLWERISPKSFYTVSFDTRELIRGAVDRLDRSLEVPRVLVRREYGEQGEAGPGDRGALRRRRTGEEAAGAALGEVRYDLVGRLVEETGLTRATVAAVLAGMAPEKFALFRLNPEAFIRRAGRIINGEKALAVVRNIAYGRLDAAYGTEILTPVRGRLGYNAAPARRSLYSYLIYDSEAERRFAQALDASEAVALYVKLPRSFFIPTPVGRYTPDWAIALRRGAARHVCLVAETKGGGPLELREVEQAKIACARAHFAAISGGGVTYGVASSFDELIRLAL